jgi:hypothetical protein
LAYNDEINSNSNMRWHGSLHPRPVYEVVDIIFDSTDDGNGLHIFSESLAHHRHHNLNATERSEEGDGTDEDGWL